MAPWSRSSILRYCEFQAQLRDLLIVHLNDVMVAILNDVHIRLYHARARTGIAQGGPRVQALDHFHSDIDVLGRPAQHLRQLPELPRLHQPQMVRHNQPRYAAHSVAALQLQQKALPQVARAHTRRARANATTFSACFFDLFLRYTRSDGRDLRERCRQVPVFIEIAT